MARSRLLVFVVGVGLVAVAFLVVPGVVRPAERWAYDVGHERTVSMQAFIDAAPAGWSVLRSRGSLQGGGSLFLASVELPNLCRKASPTSDCDALPSVVLPPGGSPSGSSRRVRFWFPLRS